MEWVFGFVSVALFFFAVLGLIGAITAGAGAANPTPGALFFIGSALFAALAILV